jgi:hypothetical protein
VPVLKIPQTLDDWTPRYAFTGRAAGWMLLSYKVLVLLPLLGLLGVLLERLQGKESTRDEAGAADDVVALDRPAGP